MIKKLRRKFIWINMLIVTLILFLILGLTVNMTKNSLEKDSLETLRASYAPEKKEHRPTEGKEEKTRPTGTPDTTEGTMVSQSSGESKLTEGASGAKEEKREKTQKNGGLPTFTLIRLETGELTAQGSDFYDLTDPDYLEALMAEAEARGTEYGVLRNRYLRFLRHNTAESSYSFMDISSELSTLWNLVLDSILIGALAFGGFLILSILLARWAVRPVERAWTQQQQFIADASHELKTPLTVVITGAELMKDPAIKDEVRQQCVENILETSGRMRSLLEEMLNLARAENVQQELMEETCDLSDILEDSVLSFEPLFFERGLELQWEIEEGLRVKGNESQLRQLADILLDNAQKYSLPGGASLRLKRSGSRSCEIVVSNPASPMKEEELDHIFQRFYRGDQARSATGSYGLGLSIARGILERHGGTIRAEQQEGRLLFRIKLRLSES